MAFNEAFCEFQKNREYFLTWDEYKRKIIYFSNLSIIQREQWIQKGIDNKGPIQIIEPFQKKHKELEKEENEF